MALIVMTETLMLLYRLEIARYHAILRGVVGAVVMLLLLSCDCYAQIFEKVTYTSPANDTVVGTIFPSEYFENDSLAVGLYVNRGASINRPIGGIRSLLRFFTRRSHITWPKSRSIDSLYTPDHIDVLKAESLFYSFLNERRNGKRHTRRVVNYAGEKCSDARLKSREILDAFANYKRQYVGYYYNGHRCVFINAWHKTVKDIGENRIVFSPMICWWSGGDLYLYVYVDLTTEKVKRMYIKLGV